MYQPLLVTSGLSGLALGWPATVQDCLAPSAVRRSELAAQALAARGARAAMIRLAPLLMRLARDKGASAYIAMPPTVGRQRTAATPLGYPAPSNGRQRRGEKASGRPIVDVASTMFSGPPSGGRMPVA